jgi:TonB family protein
MLRCIALAQMLALLIVAMVAPVAADGLCPVTTDLFLLNSTGTSKGFYQYQVSIKAENSQPLSVRFTAVGLSGNDDRTIDARKVTFDSDPRKGIRADLLFPWPKADLSGIAVQEVVTLNDGVSFPCHLNPTFLSVNGVRQTAWHFDDSSTVIEDESQASEIWPSMEFVHKVLPEVPQAVRMSSAGGTATIGVTIGPLGTVLETWVSRSSGSLTLDALAQTAAKNSSYVAPRTNGEPAAASCLITYEFGVH